MLKIGYKWLRVHAILAKDSEASNYLPDTVLFNEERLIKALALHKEVVLKPSSGTGGKSIFKLRQEGLKSYILQHGNSMIPFRNFAQLGRIIKAKELKSGSKFLIQQFIPLALVEDSPFDVRIMLQKDSSKKWVVLGKVARIAAKGKFVTNYHQGGRLMSVADALRKSNLLDKRLIPDILMHLDHASLMLNQKISRKFKSILSGMDLGIDIYGKIWFIESNPKPSLKLFEKALALRGIPVLKIS